MYHQQPLRVGTDDEVFEAYFFDDTPMVRVVMRWLFVVDGVLDASMLHSSLSQLLELPTWRRLGGRLHLNKTNKKLEFHIPRVFTSDRPAVRLSHHAIDTRLAAHPISSYLPNPTPEPSLQQCLDSAVFSRLLPDIEKLPTTLPCYFTSDQPPLTLQIISFTDSTLVTLNFPHALTDAIGLSSLIRAWCSLLASNPPSSILPLAPVDPLSLIPPPSTPHILHPFKMTRPKFLILFIRFLAGIICHPPMSSRGMQTLFLPSRTVTSLLAHHRARRDPSPQSPAQPPRPPQSSSSSCSDDYISEGDLISALILHSIIHSLPRKGPPRSLTILNTFELRSRLPAPVFDSKTYTYVQNAFFASTCLLTSSEARSLSPAGIALKLRRSLVAQTKPEQIAALVHAQRRSITKHGRPVVYSRTDGMILPISHWGRARFWEVADFGPAVVGKRGTGKVTFYQTFDADTQRDLRHRNVPNILGRDNQGNCWIAGMLSDKAWERLLSMVKEAEGEF